MKTSFAIDPIKLFSELGTGIVEETISSKYPGRVKYKATYWPAQFYNQQEETTIFPNVPVTVIGRKGITLLVVPMNEKKAS